mgnify:CR=1 FL=1
MARKVYSEDKMKELISREGDGEEVPEGSKIFYYPDFIEKGGVMIPNTGPKKKVKSITKVVSGQPRPKQGADPGSIKSQENTNFQFKGDDIDYLRKKRKKMKIKEGKSKPDTVPPFRKAGGVSIDYRKRQGGMFNKMGKK